MMSAMALTVLTPATCAALLLRWGSSLELHAIVYYSLLVAITTISKVGLGCAEIYLGAIELGQIWVV